MGALDPVSDTIELRGLTKRFGSVTAVDDVSLDVAAGELLTLLGPSGCGKTTLLRLLSGFEQPTSGSILVAGVDITALAPHRRDINQVFQSYALFPHLTVRENIAFGLKMQGVGRSETQARVDEAIALVSLGGLESRYTHQLSGGQRQRVALARAVVPRPRVLLLDEPLSALDAKLRRDMQVELRRLQRKVGVTTILVTHDQEEALAMSDRIAVMNAGRVEQLGTGEEVYHRPQTAFVAGFLGESNLLPVRVVAIRGHEVDLVAREGWPLTVTSELSCAVGEERMISVRPEKLRLARTAVAGPALKGRIVELTFLGPSVRLVVETALRQRLTVLGPEIGTAGKVKRDGEVHCAFEAADAVLLSGVTPAP
jgi:spermidine/putrescine transport system ATP-binding protein